MSLNEWKNKELGGLLTNKWGFKMNLNKLNENNEISECGDPMAVTQVHSEMPAEDCMDINGKRYCAEPEIMEENSMTGGGVEGGVAKVGTVKRGSK